MVAMVCTSMYSINLICCDDQSFWLIMRFVMFLSVSLATMCAQCMASIVVLWSVGWARPRHVHLDDFACPGELKIMSRLCIV